MRDAELNQITHDIIGAAIEVHRALGQGYSSRLMKLVWPMNLSSVDTMLSSKSRFPWYTKKCIWSAAIAWIYWSRTQ
jgi:hypothetical protein